jgi:hypothetical protein
MAQGLLTFGPMPELFHRAIRPTIMIAFCCFGIVSAQATDNYWTGGGGDNLWTNGANWSLGLPNSTQNVFIEDTGTNAVVLNANATVAGLNLGGTQTVAMLDVVAGMLTSSGTGTVQTGAVLNLSGGLLASIGVLQVDGTVNFTGGLLEADAGMVISSQGTLNLSDTNSKTLFGKFLNQGTVTCFATNLIAQTLMHFTNYGTFVVHSDIEFTPYVPSGAVFHNLGTILLPADEGQRLLSFHWELDNRGSIRAETNSVLAISRRDNAPVSFFDGTTFDGDGTVRFVYGYLGDTTFNGQMVVNGSVEFASSGSGTSQWTGPGIFYWQQYGLQNVTFGSDFHVEVVGSNQKFLWGNCTNQGIIRWIGDGAAVSSGAQDFKNYGQFIIETNCTWQEDYFGTFLNFGTILMPANEGTATFTLGSHMNFTNYGTISVETNSTLQAQVAQVPQSGWLSFADGTILDGAGTLRFIQATTSWSGLITLNTTLEFLYSGGSGPCQWTGPGLIRWQDGSGLQNFTFGPGFHVDVVGDGSEGETLSGICTNNGTIRWLGAGTLSTSYQSQFQNYGQFIIETNCNWQADSTSTFLNFGNILMPANQGTATFGPGVNFTNYGTITVETNSILELHGQSPRWLSFEDGTILNGPGILRAASSENFFGWHGLITVNGILELLTSDNYGPSRWTGPGLLRWLDNSFFENFTFGPDFHVEVTNRTVSFNFLSGICTNQGVIHWLMGTNFQVNSGAQFYNYGQFIIETNCSWQGMGSARFLNFGTILMPANKNVATLGFDSFINFTNYGTITVETNSILELSGQVPAWLSFEDGTILNGPGTLQAASHNINFGWHGLITVNGILELVGSGGYGPSRWSGPGLLRWREYSLLQNFTFAPDFHVDITGTGFGYETLSGFCTNQGTIRWLGDAPILMDVNAQFYNYGQINIETNCTLSPIGPPQTFFNFGTIDIPSGSLYIGVSCQLAPSSVINLGIGGTTPGSQFGQVNFTTPAPLTLAGTLMVTFQNGFAPSSGNSFAIVNYNSSTGAFSPTQLPPLSPGLTWLTDYGSTALTLSIAQQTFTLGNPSMGGDGSFRFDITGAAAGSLIVQATTNLNSANGWTSIATNAPFNGSYPFIDPDGSNFMQRFYRALIGP